MIDFRSLRIVSSAFLLLCLIASGGCNRGPKMVQVSGKVLYKDGTVPRAGVCVINFNPTPDSTAQIKKVAGGSIGSDGSFSLTTVTPNDGAYVGEYAVTFSVLASPIDPRSLVLPKYSSPLQTPYKVKIENDTSDLKFELEPVAGAPAPPPTG